MNESHQINGDPCNTCGGFLCIAAGNGLGCFIFIALIFFAGCSHVSSVLEPEPEHLSTVQYSVFIYIHGDAGYLYHTADGLAVQADENALEIAIEAAENGLSGEFFIYHQQPRKRFLWLIPRKSSVLYHYKKGEPVQQITYRNRSAEESF